MFRPLRHAAVPVLILALAACGSSSQDEGSSAPEAEQAADSTYPGQSAQQLLDAAKTAVAAQKAVTVNGKTASQSGTATFEVTVMDGKGASGSLEAGQATVQFRRIGELSYILANQAFYAAQGSAAASIGAKMAGHWLVADPATLNGITGMGGDASSDIAGRYPTVASVLSSSVPDGATLTRVAGKKIGGVDTTGIAFTAPVPADQAAKLSGAGATVPPSVTGTVYLATNGTPLPAAIQSNLGVDITLDAWGKTVKVVAPPKKQQVALNELLAGMGFGG